jgi:hypothetical protein
MLFERRFAAGIADGSITLTFRRWRRPQARAGHVYRTAAGRIEVDAVDIVEPWSITDGDARLARLDRAGRGGAWTEATLHMIAAHPARRAADLAEMLSRDRAEFKLDVRKLKNLGLTISLPVGYRLSPRGDAYLAARDSRSASSRKASRSSGGSTTSNG